jgi:hypothetical protein
MKPNLDEDLYSLPSLQDKLSVESLGTTLNSINNLEVNPNECSALIDRITDYSWFFTLTVRFGTWNKLLCENRIKVYASSLDPPSSTQALGWHWMILNAQKKANVNVVYTLEYHGDLEHLHVHGCVISDVMSRISNFKRNLRKLFTLDQYDRVAHKFYQKYKNKTLREVIDYHIFSYKNNVKKPTYEDQIYWLKDKGDKNDKKLCKES